jgi:3-dehydroquinate dehydratase-2
MTKVLLVNGPNINMLGKREPGIYGSLTLDEITKNLSKIALEYGVSLDSYQSNHEGDIIDKIQQSKHDIILCNAGALTHTSVGIRDAFLAVCIPFIEVHISNVYARDKFRQKSYLSDIAIGVICGFGNESYEMALRFACKKIIKKNT